MESMGKILIVEDQFLVSECLKIWVEILGFEVCGVAKSADRAIELAVQHEPNYILMDVRLEGARDGVDAALAIHGRFDTRIIYCTGSSEPSTLKRISEDHAFAVLIKPIDSTQLRTVLDAARKSWSAAHPAEAA
jgi:two-component system, response regulator PdtaR